MRVLAIQNCELEGFGLYEKHFRDHGVDWTHVRSFEVDGLPPPTDFDLLLVGGTPTSANDVVRHPRLAAVHALLAAAVRAHVPCFGICCGGQMLAGVLGAPVRRCERMEIGAYEVRLTDEGRRDPLLAGFPDTFPVFQWHGDRFEVPEGARLLVAGSDCHEQLFRRRTTTGVIFHLEQSADDVVQWTEAYADELARVGKTGEQVVDQVRAVEGEMGRLAPLLVSNLLDLVEKGRPGP